MFHGMDGSGVMGLGWIFWIIILVVCQLDIVV